MRRPAKSLFGGSIALATTPGPPRVYIGVDPGASGGLAICGASGSEPRDMVAIPMPTTVEGVWDWFSRWVEPRFAPVTAVIEKVGGYVKGNPTPGSGMFNFGASYGGLRMAMVAAGIPFEEVTPQAWQKALGIPPRGRGMEDKTDRDSKISPPRRAGAESKTQFKNRLKAKAMELCPDLRVTLATADAILIATYCRLKGEGRVWRGTAY